MVMIKEFVDRFTQNTDTLAEKFSKQRPAGYKDIVRTVIEAIQVDTFADLSPDPERIYEINDGDYQGTLLYIIAEKRYQPRKYYSVKVYYGSCSGCDTLEAIQGWEEEISSEEVSDYMTLALHIVQGLREIEG